MNVEIVQRDSKLVARTPYHPDFARKAKRIGGKWEPTSKTWVFDPRDDARVRKICQELFGEDGRTAPDVCTIRIKLGEISDRDLTIYVCGRMVARAFDRDGGAKLGPGVILISGRIGSSGSRNNPTIATSGCTVEIRDIPKALVWEALQTGDWGAPVRAVECVPEAAPIDREALEKEAAKLRERLAEIEALLGSQTDGSPLNQEVGP